MPEAAGLSERRQSSLCPLAPAHFAALGAAHLVAVLLLFDYHWALWALVASALFFGLTPLLPSFSFYLPIISRGRSRRGVALTFDDGPDPQVTPLLLDLLEKHGARATFFVTGVNAERHPELVRAILSRGHLIGNHSYCHSPFLMLKGRQFLADDVRASQRVLKGFGITPLAFRPPVGVTSPHLWWFLLLEGLYCLNFNCRAFDMGNRWISGLALRLVRQAAGGDIILVHDVMPRGGDVGKLLNEFEKLITGLRAKGLEIVPLDRLIGKEVMRRGVSAGTPDAAELFYDGLAETYDEEQFYSGVFRARRKEMELFSSRLPELFSGADRVLDMGAGTGIFSLIAAKHCREVVAVDISRSMLSILERKAAQAGISNVRTVAGDLEEVALEGTFSVACAFSSLEHVTDLPALLRRVARHMEPGGTLYFLIARRSLLRVIAQIGNAMRQGVWLKAYSRGEMESILWDAGFEPREIVPQGFRSWFSGGTYLEVCARRDARGAESVPAASVVETAACRAAAVEPSGGSEARAASGSGAPQWGSGATTGGEPAAPKTLLVIPVYNHAGTLRGVVERALAQGFPVLVVDDGSTDGSLYSLSGLPIERRRFPVNRGKGAAILAGAAAARQLGYEAILTLDADGQHDPAEARLLVNTAAAFWPAIVIGARRMESGGAPSSSIFGRDFSNFWVKMESGHALPDTQSGFRLYPVGFLTSRGFLSRRYSFEVEVLVRAAWAGVPVRSTPVSVDYSPGGGRVSHFHRFKDNLRLSCLHTWLVTRSLLPYPHDRMFGAAEKMSFIPVVTNPLEFFRQVAREHASAGDLAAAVWVGIFLGSLPIMPFGVATILYVSHKLHLNKLAGFGASNVCVAPFVPLLCIEAGHFFRFGRLWTEFTRQTLLVEIHHRLWEWLLGSLVVGPALGAVGAVFTYYLVKRLRARVPDPVQVRS